MLGVESIPLDEHALGRVTAEPIWAKISSPHYHASAMDGFAVRAVAANEFETWSNAQRGAGPTLDAAAYKKLTEQSINEPPSMFGAVTPGLFGQVVRQVLAPGPGPATDRGSAAEAPAKGH